MRLILQFCLLLLVLLGAEPRAWGKVDVGQNIASGGLPLILVDCTDGDAPPALITQGEPGPWDYEPAPDVCNGPNLYAYVKQNPWTGWDPDGLKKRSDYQADYDTAKTNQEALGKVDVRKMTPGQFIKHGAAYAKAGQDMKKAQEGINKIEATAKEVNQAIDTINSVRKKLGYEGEIPFHVNAEGLDDESHDHKVIFDIASNWSNAKQKAFESLTGVAVGGVAKLGGALMARGATPGMARVTSWADEGITPDLNPGRWVQMGDATNWNFIKTGLGGPKIYRTDKFPFFTKESSRVPFANSVTGEVPTSSLRWPSGWEKIKGILGQRQIQE
jgi:hypothetical protein